MKRGAIMKSLQQLLNESNAALERTRQILAVAGIDMDKELVLRKISRAMANGVYSFQSYSQQPNQF